MMVQGTSFAAASAGFLLGFSLIFSIGPQNLHLLRAGLSRRHALTTATTGYFSEIVLVGVGLAGLGLAAASYPSAVDAMRWLGVAFLITCGIRAILRRADASCDLESTSALGSRGKAVLAMLAVTWLNPLVYVEVVLLVGLLSSGYSGTSGWFGAGFLIASSLKFYGWSLAGQLLSPAFQHQRVRTAFSVMSGALLLAAAAVLAGTTSSLLA
jgi:L-lysine exporter family protein LysE/ArgO